MAWAKRGVASAAGTEGDPPALFTSTSSRPHCSTALAMTALGLGRLADVGRHEHGAVDLRLVAAAGDDVGAGVEEGGDDPGAHAPRAARDHDHLVDEVEGRLLHGRQPYGTSQPPAPGPPSWRM